MKVTRTSETTPGPADWFTGAVFLDTAAAPGNGARISASNVHFTPGARTPWHRHGASPTRFMTHLAMQEVDDDGRPATWGDHVTDEEYAAAPLTGD